MHRALEHPAGAVLYSRPVRGRRRGGWGNVNLDPVLELLRDLAAERTGSLGELVAAVQQDLRSIAHRERVVVGAGTTLSTTALVNEAYIRLSEGRLPEAMDRRHFFGVASRAMRQILVDYARAQRAAKRGGGKAHESLSAAEHVGTDAAADEMIALDDALATLASASARAAEVVELRYFGGLTDAEIATLLGVNEATVRRDWIKARGWLYQRLEPGKRR